MKGQRNWRFGVVGNIVKTHVDDAGILRCGTPAFRGGARVYLDGKNWNGSPDGISVIGINRARRCQIADVPLALIENVRCCRILAPQVLALLQQEERLDGWLWWGRTAEDRRETEAFAAAWTQRSDKRPV